MPPALFLLLFASQETLTIQDTWVSPPGEKMALEVVWHFAEYHRELNVGLAPVKDGDQEPFLNDLKTSP